MTTNQKTKSGEIVGRIHSFQSLGTLDGPGLRCVIFMQGCPQRCLYCHNPDTWDFTQGKVATVEEILAKVSRYKSYFGIKGGVTISGGEPLCQGEFVEALIEACHQEQINVAVDTGGAPFNFQSQKVLALADLVLLDLKFVDKVGYEKYCAGSFQDTMATLAYLNSINKPTWLRQVVLTGVHDQKANIDGLKKVLLAHNCIEKLELLPFRKLCLEKYENMGIDFPLKKAAETSLAVIEAMEANLKI